MSTCRCGRDNDARRCYCGACGRRIGKACARCQFVNSTEDAYCGGCGDAIAVEAAAVVVSAKPAPAPAPAPPTTKPKTSDGLSAEELAAMLGKARSPAAAQLPNVVSQDDLDKLFGSVS